MQNKRKSRRVVVIGVGSMLLKDDGIGVHAIQNLEQENLFLEDVDVELIDGGTAPDLSVFLQGSVNKLIIIDAIQAHGQPGAIYRFTPDELQTEGQEIKSLHHLNIMENIALMRIGGILPSEIIIIGVEPGDMEWGVTLTSEVKSKLPELLSIVRREIVV
jgi:hydrogenase maturation protease